MYFTIILIVLIYLTIILIFMMYQCKREKFDIAWKTRIFPINLFHETEARDTRYFALTDKDLPESECTKNPDVYIMPNWQNDKL